MRWFKRTVLNFLQRFSPELASRMETARHRNHIRRFEKSIGLDRLVDRFLDYNECVVQGGPFQGMRYIDKSSGSALLPKLLGCYEQELSTAMEEAISRRPNLIIDVGCAEGYYAIGLARRLPEARVIAYEIDSHAQASCLELAHANAVNERIQIAGRCDHAELAIRITSKTLLVCDCEGFEWQLLDPSVVQPLAAVDMIVELHGLPVDECKREIQKRFSTTHTLQFIDAEPRSGNEIPSILELSDADRTLACNELRTDGQLWVWARAKSK
jgi:hypothetical protein